MIIDVTGVELTPGYLGKDCAGLGVCCDECDYLLCCLEDSDIGDCKRCLDRLCPRSACYDARRITLLRAYIKKIIVCLKYKIYSLRMKIKIRLIRLKNKWRS